MELNLVLVLLQLLFVALIPGQVQSESNQPSTTLSTVKPQISSTTVTSHVNHTTPDNATTSGNTTTSGNISVSWNGTAQNMTITPDNTTIYDNVTVHDNTTLYNTTTYNTATTLATNLSSVNMSTSAPKINASTTTTTTTTLHPQMPILDSNKSTPVNSTTPVPPTSTLSVNSTEQDTNSSVTSAAVNESSQTSSPSIIPSIKTPAQNQTSSMQQDVGGITVGGISSDENTENVHNKSGRSLALGITIPLLIVLIVIGVIWIRRRFKKVQKSGTGYLTLEEEAHSFGSIQSPTYDLDL